MKKGNLLLLGILACFTALAQQTISVGIKGNINTVSYGGNGGYGADLTYLVPAGPDGAVRISAGFDRFPKAFALIGNEGYNPVSFLPLRAGYHRYLYSDNVFVYGEAGLALIVPASENKTGFTYSFGTGYKLNLPKSRLLQFSLSFNRSRYEPERHFSWFSLGAAYGFKFGTRKSFRRDD